MRGRLVVGIMLSLVFCLGHLVSAGDLRKRLPPEERLAEFKMVGEPATYSPADLWRYINGGAPGYLAYGFEDLVTFTAIHQERKLEIVVDIYDMGKPINAFGIYSVERSPDGERIELGGGGFVAGGVLYFWQDRYYVKLMANAITPETNRLLSELAGIVSRDLPDTQALPKQLAVFPEEGRIKNSDRYIRTDVLGQDYLQNAFRVEYSQKGHQYSIFLIEGTSPKKSALNLEKYMAYLDEGRELFKQVPDLGKQAFVGKDSFYGLVIFARKSHFIIGVMGHNDRNAAINIIKAMFARLERE
jgi:hypothetical protein